MQCLNCGEVFQPLTVIQKYCSEKCGYEYRKVNQIKYESITFNCSKCGNAVVTEPKNRDKRTRFCSKECEKKYWRKPPHEHKSSYHNVYLKKTQND